ncbi:ABC transporter permease [Enterovibrio norvegicus]|uniref:ABC transporter permease n=3 Tax=Enterovibrio norvegicus TaxID=188144 RepID=A0A2N7L9J3_9GAMM|nr:ABC transporter permease subunit [Enterovibrio norvegicus]MCC4796549.1 ABC transporter permease subunit [Enterovibrio norvegicus]OEE65566.1 peptide ABC transporter permease [Enterovibrio norvegicus]OEF52396.1 peptide ABC transporter permease [Enterovibrio norvegicus]OEF55370.1 peptide ABC transporter permease [Enterovibrio norvegicus]PMH64267.1 peptide ABC transporter permease [Enterovibrio norvegicus]
MLIYALRRLNLFIITLLILTLIGYNILRLDPSSIFNQQEFWVGWMHYLKQLLQGDLGVAANGTPITESLARVFPATLELCFFAFLLALIIGIPLGTLAGIRRGSPADIAISSITLLTFSIPIFWMAILMIMVFSLYLGWLPVSGRYNLLFEIPQVTGFALVDVLMSNHPQRSQALEDIIRHLIMPTLVLAVAPTTEIITLLRDSVSDVMGQNYIKAAATKGLSKSEIVMRHVLKNALPPIIPKFGIQISTMMTFAIITESIFNWPGIGTWLLDALSFQDYVAVQAGVLTVGSIVLLANIFSDLAGAAISPLARKEWYALK